MKARDVISPSSASAGSLPARTVAADTAVIDLLPRLLDTADHRLGVADGDTMLGVIDESSLLDGLNRLISPRDDSSLVVVETTPADYSASLLARAVEDADVHLVDLLSAPGKGDRILVTLRVRTEDPSGVVSSLERHGYEVVETSAEISRNVETAMERLLSLNTLLGV